jgi:hypothetical protein
VLTSASLAASQLLERRALDGLPAVPLGFGEVGLPGHLLVVPGVVSGGRRLFEERPTTDGEEMASSARLSTARAREGREYMEDQIVGARSARRLHRGESFGRARWGDAHTLVR